MSFIYTNIQRYNGFNIPFFFSYQDLNCLFFSDLMRDPILQDKRQEHVRFQKYALELLERVSGKSKPNDNGLEVSLANIHRVSYSVIIAI